MKHKSGAGFTIVELLVVAFIIILISGSILANYGRGQEQYAVSIAAQKFVADLRRAQNMALAGRQLPAGCVNLNCSKGFGVYSDTAGQYVIFYNYKFDGSNFYNVNSVRWETLVLEKVALAPTGKDVFFIPPDPTTYINGVLGVSQAFTLTSTNGNYSKTVTVYSGGRIEIQ